MIIRHEAYDLSQRNTFGMKVSCRLYVEVTDPEDLLTLDFDALPQPLFVMGGGSNLLFTKDFPGTVLHLAIRFLDSALPGSTRNDKGTDFGNGKTAATREAVLPVISTQAEGRAEKSVVLMRVGAGVVFDDFCAWAAAEGLWGPENLSLIPGEVGASAVQNIGAYGVEAKDIIDTVHAFDRTTRTFVDIPGAECAYGYRTSRFKTEWKGRYLITAVTFHLSSTPQPKLDYGGVRKALEARFLDSALPGSARNDKRPDSGNGKTAATRESVLPIISTQAEGRVENSENGQKPVMPGLIGQLTPQLVRDTIIGIRREKLPDPEEIGSAGSFFCNPVVSREHFERIVAIAKAENGPEYVVPHYDVGDCVKVPAAWMIDQCGFKGAREGGAQVYPKQPLVIVNATGSATPDEIVALERRVIDTIREKYGVELHPEVEHVAAQETDN
jgi:UDP-N-acetylmuramate dehydrogenase